MPNFGIPTGVVDRLAAVPPGARTERGVLTSNINAPTPDPVPASAGPEDGVASFRLGLCRPVTARTVFLLRTAVAG